MKIKSYIFLLFAAVLFFSCVGKEDKAAAGKTTSAEAKKNIDANELARIKEKEMMKEFIYNNDHYFQERDAEIVYIEKADFGIPGGENWIVRLNSMHILIYVINGDKIEEDYYGTVSGQYFIDQYLDEVSVYDIMRDIPGTHLPDGCVSFGDFNGDGKDELFRFLYVKELGHNIDIFHYDLQKKGFVFCRIRFKIINHLNGPAPVEFIYRNGMYGFKVFYSNIEASGGQRWVPEPDPENDKWIFYAWDRDQRMYVDMGEVAD